MPEYPYPDDEFGAQRDPPHLLRGRPTDAFSGSQLGWRPVVTDDTDAFTDSSGTSYDQVVSAGAVVPPNARQIEGLSNGGTLARSTAGHGLGTAIVDARVKLLIPVTADAGVYETTVTITAI